MSSGLPCTIAPLPAAASVCGLVVADGDTVNTTLAAAAQQAEQAAIEGTPALMKAPLMDPSKNPQITRGEPTPPPEE